MANYMNLPAELKYMVLEYLRGDRIQLNKICYVSKEMADMARPIMYETALLSTAPNQCSQNLLRFLRTILQNPKYAERVEKLRFAVSLEYPYFEGTGDFDFLPLREKSNYEFTSRNGTKNLALRYFENMVNGIGAPLPLPLENWKGMVNKLQYSGLAGLLLTALPNLKELDLTCWAWQEYRSGTGWGVDWKLFWNRFEGTLSDLYGYQPFYQDVYPYLTGLKTVTKLTTMAHNIHILRLPFHNLKSLNINLVDESIGHQLSNTDLSRLQPLDLPRSYSSISHLTFRAHLNVLATNGVLSTTAQKIPLLVDSIGCQEISDLEVILIESSDSSTPPVSGTQRSLSFDSLRNLIEKFSKTLTSLSIDYNTCYGNGMHFDPYDIMTDVSPVVDGIRSLRSLENLRKLEVLGSVLMGKDYDRPVPASDRNEYELVGDVATMFPLSLEELTIVAPCRVEISVWLEELLYYRPTYSRLRKVTLACKHGTDISDPTDPSASKNWFQNPRNGAWRLPVLRRLENVGLEVRVVQRPSDHLWEPNPEIVVDSTAVPPLTEPVERDNRE